MSRFVTTIDNSQEGNFNWNFKFWAKDFNDAQKHFVNPVSRLISEIPTKEDGITPDWENRIDYQN